MKWNNKLILLITAFLTFSSAGMSVNVTDENRIPAVIDELQKLQSMQIEVGIMGDADSEMQMIATVNEFGAKIKITQKMAAFLALRAKELDLPKKTKKGDGYIDIPARSFLRYTFDNETAMNRAFKNLEIAVERIFMGTGTAEQAANVIGQSVVDAIKNRIRSNIQPANSAFTVANKGTGKNTLIDSGRLIGAITWRLV